VVLITGSTKSLFVPLAMAVVFAMLTSYFLSRTLVPTLVRYLLRGEAERHASGHQGAPGKGAIARFFAAFERGFERLRHAYGSLLALALARREFVIAGFSAFVLVSLSIFTLVGRDFFPNVDADLMKLHVRGPPETRIEENERRFANIESTIREVVPHGE